MGRHYANHSRKQLSLTHRHTHTQAHEQAVRAPVAVFPLLAGASQRFPSYSQSQRYGAHTSQRQD